MSHRSIAFGAGDRPVRCLVAVLIVGIGLLFTLTPSFADDYEPGAVQVRLANGASIGAVNATYGTTTIDSLPPSYLLAIPPETTEEGILATLLSDPSILEAEYAWRSETPEGVRQMVVAAVGGTIDDYLDQAVAQRIHLPEVHEYTKGDGVVVAVLDTGVLATHPAFSGAILPGGWDFVDNDSDPTDAAGGFDEDEDGQTDEGAGHGTMVAGIVHLVAPEAKILPIRVLNDEGVGRSFNVAKGIRYAVESGAQVINLSLGLLLHTFVITNEVADGDSLGVSLVSGAGNLGAENPAYFPGSDWRVFSVAALDSNDVKADFSNWHFSLEISAPGVGIMAPYYDGEYAVGAGTSFAAPFISGQIALIRSIKPGLIPNQIREVVSEGVVDVYSIPENAPYIGMLGSGRVDGLATLAAASTVAVPAGGEFSQAQIPRVHPNPIRSGGVASIDVPVGFSGGAYEILDLQGRRLWSVPASVPSGQSLQIDLSGASGRSLPPGIYFIRLFNNDRAAIARLVKLD